MGDRPQYLNPTCIDLLNDHKRWSGREFKEIAEGIPAANRPNRTVSDSYVRQIFRAAKPASRETLMKICSAMDLLPSELDGVLKAQDEDWRLTEEEESELAVELESPTRVTRRARRTRAANRLLPLPGHYDLDILHITHPDDAANSTLLHSAKQLYEHYMDPDFADPFDDIIEWLREATPRSKKAEEEIVLLAKRNDQVVGFLEATLYKSDRYNEWHSAYVNAVCVDHNHRVVPQSQQELPELGPRNVFLVEKLIEGLNYVIHDADPICATVYFDIAPPERYSHDLTLLVRQQAWIEFLARKYLAVEFDGVRWLFPDPTGNQSSENEKPVRILRCQFNPRTRDVATNGIGKMSRNQFIEGPSHFVYGKVWAESYTGEQNAVTHIEYVNDVRRRVEESISTSTVRLVSPSRTLD